MIVLTGTMNSAKWYNRRLFPARILFLLFLVFGSASLNSYAQFYNGSQLTFGKCRVQFKNFLWAYFRFEKFDTYYYLNGKELAMYTAEYADTHIKEIETELQSTLEQKVQFIIFNNLTDLKQSNIGLENDWDSYNTGGITRIIGGKVMIYFDGNYDHLERQIRAGIAQIILNEMIYGTGIGSQIKNNAIFTMPEWYMNGLVSYISEKWNPEVDNRVRDAILNKEYEKFNHLVGEEATYAGHSLWNYISLKYGESAIPNIVYIARLNRNVEKGFFYVLGISFKDLIAQWLDFYKGIYNSEDPARTEPAGNKVITKKRKLTDKVYRQLKISPDGKYAAYCVHDLGVYKVFLYDLEKKKSRRIYRGGYRLADKPDFSFPILSWYPTGEVLAIITEKKGEDYLYFYSLKAKTFDLQILHDFQKILDFSYSDDGSKLVFSAVQKGQSDIFVYNIIAGSYEQITKDVYDDLNPRFIQHSSQIIFSSNRSSDTIRFDPVVAPKNLHFNHDIFVYDYAGKKPVLKRITATPLVDELQPMEYDDRFLCFLSDQNGIYNRFLARFDSAITYIDTATHYRYFTTMYPVTNYSRNLLEQDVSTRAALIGDVSMLKKRFLLLTSDRIEPKYIKPQPVQNTFYKNFKTGYSQPGTLLPEKDTIQKKPEMGGPAVKKHFTTVRINEPQVGNPKTAPFPQGGPVTDTVHRSFGNSSQQVYGSAIPPVAGKDTTDKYRNSRPLNYNVEYSVNQTVTQIDFNYLNSAYQPFTGIKDPIFINPGLNALFMVGVTDLMEDYRMIGGVRINFNFINNEYLFSYSNLRRRLDHEIIFHRQSIEEAGYYSYVRHRIHELYYIATYPFTPVLNIKGTATFRYDRAVYLATDQLNLMIPDVNRYWGSLKAELTYDNTRNTGLNLYNGTRYKIFGEYYQLLNATENNVVVLGADFRHYEKIHRSMILALRFAASTSFGSNRLLYYMGGVDNWLFPSFDTKASVANNQNYVFQTLATNMRGFNQNIRNGNSFALINAEIRLPVFRYFFNRPIRSEFLNNFQLNTFVDVGTAWTGWNPYSESNQLFTSYIDGNPLYIQVQLMKDPIVEGFGGGLRTKIFGYFVRGDLAWGVEEGIIHKPIFYLSLSTDF
jgi:Tol biopolymer transport system component